MKPKADDNLNRVDEDGNQWVAFPCFRNIAIKAVLCLFFTAANFSTSIAYDAPTPNATLCSTYREGHLKTLEIPVYDWSVKGRKLLYWSAWVFTEAYDAFPNSPRFTDSGDPEYANAFDINIPDGKAIPYNQRLDMKPSQDTVFGVLVRSVIGQSLGRIIPILADVPLTDEDFKDGQLEFRPPNFKRTGEMFHGYERITVIDAQPVDGLYTQIFIEEDEGKNLIGVLTCNSPGSVPVPHCQLYEHLGPWELKISQFRRNQMDQIETIKKHARAFTACLTWKE